MENEEEIKISELSVEEFREVTITEINKLKIKIKGLYAFIIILLGFATYACILAITY